MHSFCHSIDIFEVSADCQTQSSAEGRGRNIGKVHGGHGGGHNGLSVSLALYKYLLLQVVSIL